ncbi:hypothetical protein EHI96_09495 [Cronobacter malonaticus]|uniref:hypothetical protein n=1 Tax=Cronobacter malonaticus TaxID=413503 RepID=UPI001375922B|nr:hypothetical protein [Cronobacter malonaticus]NCI00086.1 hypothetical protein [Cronobacter malonaticus]
MIRSFFFKFYKPLLVLGFLFVFLLYFSWILPTNFALPKEFKGGINGRIDSCRIDNGLLAVDGWAFIDQDMYTKTNVVVKIGENYRPLKTKTVKRRDVVKVYNLPLTLAPALKGFTGTIYIGKEKPPFNIAIIVARKNGEYYRGDYVCKG